MLLPQALISAVPRRKKALIQRPTRPNRHLPTPLARSPEGGDGAGEAAATLAAPPGAGRPWNSILRRIPAHDKPLPAYAALLGPLTARTMSAAEGGGYGGSHSAALAAMAAQV